MPLLHWVHLCIVGRIVDQAAHFHWLSIYRGAVGAIHCRWDLSAEKPSAQCIRLAA